MYISDVLFTQDIWFAFEDYLKFLIWIFQELGWILFLPKWLMDYIGFDNQNIINLITNNDTVPKVIIFIAFLVIIRREHLGWKNQFCHTNVALYKLWPKLMF